MKTSRVLAAAAARIIASGAIMAGLCAALAAPAAAAEAGIIDGVKFGVLAHDIIETHRAERGTDINAEILFTPTGLFRSADQADWVNTLLDPQPIIGITANTSGYTSQFYFGADWHLDLWRSVFAPADQIYSEFSAGGAVHDGKTGANDPHREALGSRILFHLSLELGYAFGAHYSLGAYYEHDSNGGLAKYNRSLNNVGIRFGYRF